MVFNPRPGVSVEKLMSFTRTEFENGLARFTGAPARLDADGRYDLSPAAGGLPVSCSFVPQPDAVLGGLVRLPRVQVTLDLSALADEDRAPFVELFDKTFQRGGG